MKLNYGYFKKKKLMQHSRTILFYSYKKVQHFFS